MFNTLCNDCDNLNNIFLVLSPNNIGNQNYTQQPWREGHTRHRHIYQMTGKKGVEAAAKADGKQMSCMWEAISSSSSFTYAGVP